MENRDQELVKKMLRENEVFKRTYKAHKDYDGKLAKLEKRPHLSPADKAEVNRLKKLKLALKDEMNKMISAHAKG